MANDKITGADVSAPVPPKSPDWLDHQRAVYHAAINNCFILYGNVEDSANVTRTSVRDHLIRLFGNAGFIVAVYNRGNYLTLYPEGAETYKNFAKFSGLELGSTAPSDPFGAAASGKKGTSKTQYDGPTDTRTIMPLLTAFLKNGVKSSEVKGRMVAEPCAAVLIEEAQIIAPASDWTAMPTEDRTNIACLKTFASDKEIASSGNIVMLLTQNDVDVHPGVRALYETIEVPMPNYDQRMEFIETFIADKTKRGVAIEWEDGFGPAQLAAYTGGISLNNVDNILLRAAQTKRMTRGMARDRKQRIFASIYGEVLTFLEGDLSDADMPGMQAVKLGLMENVVTPIALGQFDLLSKGVLLMGGPGMGKTRIIRWLGWKTGWQINKLMFGGQIASKYVGEGERNLVQALRGIDSQQNAIVFVDEIDKAMPQETANGSNTQDIRMLQIFQEWLSDDKRRGKSVVIFATNYPNRLQDAFIRAGRIDLRLVVTVPNAEERRAILAYHLASRKLNLTPDELERAVKRTEGWTPAEIGDDLVPKIARVYLAANATKKGSMSVNEAVEEGLRTTRPSTTGVVEQTELALSYVSDTRYLPPEYQARFGGKDKMKMMDEAADAIAKELMGLRGESSRRKF